MSTQTAQFVNSDEAPWSTVDRSQVVGLRWVQRPYNDGTSTPAFEGVLQQGFRCEKRNANGTEYSITWEDVPYVLPGEE